MGKFMPTHVSFLRKRQLYHNKVGKSKNVSMKKPQKLFPIPYVENHLQVPK